MSKVLWLRMDIIDKDFGITIDSTEGMITDDQYKAIIIPLFKKLMEARYKNEKKRASNSDFSDGI